MTFLSFLLADSQTSSSFAGSPNLVDLHNSTCDLVPALDCRKKCSVEYDLRDTDNMPLAKVNDRSGAERHSYSTSTIFSIGLINRTRTVNLPHFVQLHLPRGYHRKLRLRKFLHVVQFWSEIKFVLTCVKERYPHTLLHSLTMKCQINSGVE